MDGPKGTAVQDAMQVLEDMQEEHLLQHVQIPPALASGSTPSPSSTPHMVPSPPSWPQPPPPQGLPEHHGTEERQPKAHRQGTDPLFGKGDPWNNKGGIGKGGGGEHEVMGQLKSLEERMLATMEARARETQAAVSKAMEIQIQAEGHKTVTALGGIFQEEIGILKKRMDAHDEEIRKLKAAYEQSQQHIATLNERQHKQDTILAAMAKKIETLELKSSLEESRVSRLEHGIAKDMDVSASD
eukprot:12402980-Karenia_brevis.AAC.1